MFALSRLLYPSPTRSRSPVAIIGWWERRRLSFNLVVGVAGLVSFGVVTVAQALPPFAASGGIPLILPVAYAIMANICYSAGWAGELAFNAWWQKDPPAIGPVLFRQGVIFSVGLTLLPVAMAGVGWAVRLARWILSF